jgi:hypothetical protein
MRILILSFYYSPDLCAGSFRASALVKALLLQLDKGSVIDVMTTMPNRYSSFESSAEEYEEHPQLNIYRIPLPSHQSGMVDQSFSFLAFAKAVIAKTKDQGYAFVFATSSRLMTAALGAYIARKKNLGLYLDIRDIFVDTINDVMPGKAAFFLKPFLSIVERFTISRALNVNLVSEGFRSYFCASYPEQNYSFFTNGIDDEFLEAISIGQDVVVKEPNRIITVLYAGNMGEGQGLHVIIPELAKRLEGEVTFRLIGDGGRKAYLERNLADAGCRNVELLPPVPRDQLIKEYQRADVLFLHLNNYQAFEKVLPSKLFEYGAFGKPIWAGVAGYAAQFIEDEMVNAVVFRPCDVVDAVSAFRKLNMSDVFRESFIKKYSRINIMNDMAADILNVARKTSEMK